MLKEWISKLDDCIIPLKDFAPYPPIAQRKAWDGIDNKMKLDFLAKAEEYLNFEWPSLPATYFMEFNRSGDRTIFQTPYFQRRKALTALVIAECVENKGRFTDDIINGIWCICEESFWGVSAHNGLDNAQPLPNVENRYIDLFAAETAGLLTFVKYLIHDTLNAITPVICRRIDIELEEQIKLPFLNRLDFWWMGYSNKTVNNWNPWIAANVLSVFLLNEHDDTRRNAAIAKLLDCVDKFIDTYGEDGGCDEGTSYWNVAGGALFDVLDQLYIASNKKINLFSESLIKEIGRFIYRSHISKGYYINFADGAAKPQLCANMVYRYGKRIKDDKLTNLGAYIGYNDVETEMSNPLRRLLPEIFNFTEFTNADKTPPLERDTWLKDIHVMSARATGGCDKGLYLAAKGGHNAESHNHNDIGSCIVYFNGMPALIDIGVATYTKKTFSSERYSIFTMKSEYHNLPTINTVTQLNGEEYAATNVKYVCTDEHINFSLNIENAYPKEAQVKTYTRSYDFFRNSSSKIVISDHFEFEKNDNEIILNFITWEKPHLLCDGKLEIKVSKTDSLILSYPLHGTIDFTHEDTNDSNLHKVWGDVGITKTAIKYTNLSSVGDIKVEIMDSKNA